MNEQYLILRRTRTLAETVIHVSKAYDKLADHDPNHVAMLKCLLELTQELNAEIDNLRSSTPTDSI